MPQYLAPGVYVEEVPSAIQPIAGVGTSTAGFIGIVTDDVVLPLRPGTDQPYPRAAEGVATLVTSWDEFKRGFGEIGAGNLVLANAVYGFFNNGGSRAWVTGVADLTENSVRTALEGFEAIDEIAIVAAPGAVTKVAQEAILSHCENAADRFAILDGQQAATPTAATVMTARNSDYGAIYYPWIDVGLTAPGDDGAEVPVYQPPSGHIAGVYARVDTERGVFKAPANEVIRGALGVETLVSKAAQAELNPAGVNVIRLFGNSVTVWGARTMTGDRKPEWTYISSRRLFLFLRESIDQGTQWAVFEPNGPELWSKVRRNVGAFLTTVWESGALLGDTAAQAFYVRCDENTNPEEVRDLGQLVTEVGVALVRPAEFVVFRISQWSGPAAG